MRKFALFAMMAIFGVVLSACGGSGGSSKPEDVALSFVESMYEGDADKAYSMIYLPEKDLKEPGFEEIIQGKLKVAVDKSQKKADENGGVKSVSVANSEIDPDNEHGKVTIATEFKNSDSKPKTDKIKVIQVDGTWKVRI